MKVVIYEPKPEEKKEEILRLRLLPSQSCSGGISLVIVDEEGRRKSGGSILAIRSDGTLYRFSLIDHPFLQKDLDGKIKETCR